MDSRQEQLFSSKLTSINSKKTPKIFKSLEGRTDIFPNGGDNLDIGSGKYDTLTVSLAERYGVVNHPYDPYNREDSENNEALRKLGEYHSCTISNVLNVIKESSVRRDILLMAHRAITDSGYVCITVYEGDRSSRGKATKVDCWQENRPLRSYLPEVCQVFPSVKMERGVIIARKH